MPTADAVCSKASLGGPWGNVEHGPMGDVVGREAFKEGFAQWSATVPDSKFSVENVFQKVTLLPDT